jgi:hypothetical protein
MSLSLLIPLVQGLAVGSLIGVAARRASCRLPALRPMASCASATTNVISTPPAHEVGNVPGALLHAVLQRRVLLFPKQNHLPGPPLAFAYARSKWRCASFRWAPTRLPTLPPPEWQLKRLPRQVGRAPHVLVAMLHHIARGAAAAAVMVAAASTPTKPHIYQHTHHHHLLLLTPACNCLLLGLHSMRWHASSLQPFPL